MAAASVPASPYLDGVFAPVEREVAVADLRVVGELPRELAGTFLRNSSNPRFAPSGRYHWFDGDGMIHAVRLGDGRADYRNRWIRTQGFVREEQAGRALYPGIMEAPDPALPDGPYKNTANTDLAWHDGRVLALWYQGGDAYQVRLPDLETLGPCDFGGTLATGIGAHPKLDPTSGELCFFHCGALDSFLDYGVVSRQGRVVHGARIPLPGPRQPHDMAITPRFSIVFDFPLFYDPELLGRGRMRTVFDRATPSRIGVIPRFGRADEIRWFEAAPCYVYHAINAHEEGDQIVLVGCSISNPVRESHDNPRGLPRIGALQLEPHLWRWRLDLATGACKEEQLDDVPAEFPRAHDGRLGQRLRYGYVPRIASRTELLFDGLIKYDVETGSSETYAYPAGQWGGEVSFAPRPGALGEDDGWLLTFVIDERDGRSELFVFDARELARGPIARVQIPARVPIGYHTRFVPQAA